MDVSTSQAVRPPPPWAIVITEWALDSYEKANTSVDQRMMARFKTHMNLLSQGRYIHRGYL